jgi:hypothetical protein
MVNAPETKKGADVDDEDSDESDDKLVNPERVWIPVVSLGFFFLCTVCMHVCVCLCFVCVCVCVRACVCLVYVCK